MFISGKLAMYFGFASEYKSIKESNPHLNFDITMSPQMSGSSINATFGKVYGLAVSKSSKNINPAIEAAFTFAGKENLKQLASLMNLPPSRRDLLAEKISAPALSVFYKSALQSRAWLEPAPAEVSAIFRNMIDSAITGKKRVSEAVRDAETLLEAELQKINSL